jgi:nitrite reductase/ring-hydroxylating ferredoxin subunit
VRVCALADLAPGEIRAVPGLPIVVCRVSGRGSGAGAGVYAFGSACTHMRAPLRAGTVVDGCLQCPLHGARFQLGTGAVRRGPARRALPVYPVVIEAGQVYVDPRPRRPARWRWWPW